MVRPQCRARQTTNAGDEKRVLLCDWGLVDPKCHVAEKVIIIAPTHAPDDTVRLVTAQFGKYGSILEIPQMAHQVFAKTTQYSVCYEATNSVVIAHGVVFEVSTGEISVVGNPNSQRLDHLYTQLPDNCDEHPEDSEWWRFKLGKMYGSTDAITEQTYRLTATNLAANAEYMEA